MNALELIRTRRSTRVYRENMVEDELLQQVLEAGRYAPSGGNNQTTHFLVIRDKAVLEHLADLVKGEFSKMEVTEGMYASMAGAIRASKKEFYHFHYDAPVLIVTANKKGYGNAIADCACCLENMMIMANALDLGTCWINQLKWLNENEVIVSYLESLGLTKDEQVWGALSLGYAKSEDGLPGRIPLERKGNVVTFVG